MIIHIVKENETLTQIMDDYKISKNDIVSNNRHITDFKKLKAGTKLKIPLLNEEVIENLEESEPFIEEYYNHKIDDNADKEIIKEEKENNEQKEKIKETREELNTNNNLNLNKNSYQNYYDYYYNYYKNYYENYYKYYYEYYKYYYRR